MRDNCTEPRDLAMIDMLASTGMRVGEMVLLNRNDIDLTSVNVSYLEKETKNEWSILMHEQRYIYRIT